MPHGRDIFVARIGVARGCLATDISKLWADDFFQRLKLGVSPIPFGGRPHDLLEVRSGVQSLVSEQLEEHAAEGVDIDPHVNVVTKQLLRCHVAGRAENLSGFGLSRAELERQRWRRRRRCPITVERRPDHRASAAGDLAMPQSRT